VPEQPDQEHHFSMLNRVEIMKQALRAHQPGRSRLANLANTVFSLNLETWATMVQAWRSINDPRWQGPAHARFIAQRYAELSLCYTLIQTAYDELCATKIIAKEDQTELTTNDMAALRAADEKLTRRRRPRAKVAA
jgi:hypothetical protein